MLVKLQKKKNYINILPECVKNVREATKIKIVADVYWKPPAFQAIKTI